MQNETASELDQLVRKRFEITKGQRDASRSAIWKRNPLLAETDTTRSAEFASRMGAESIQGDSIDYLPSSFLSLGARRAHAVAIIRSGTGGPLGTGFMISPDLFITNNHVLETMNDAATALIEFDFTKDDQGLPERSTRYALDPGRFWVSNSMENLDFSIIAVGERLDGNTPLSMFGFLPLSDRPDKHSLGMAVNIVEHPQGRRQQIVVRENRLLARGGEGERCLHYSADTEEGASGSPVMNDAWEVIALHHWGIPHLDTVTVNGEPIPETVNEGIRISVIVKQLRQDIETLPTPMQPILRTALSLGENVSAGTAEEKPTPNDRYPRGESTTHGEGDPSMQVDATVAGSSLIIPLEIRVLPAIPGAIHTASLRPGTPGTADGAGTPLTGLKFAEAIKVDRDYSNRKGYNAQFIDGFIVSLPEIVAPRVDEVAPLLIESEQANSILDYQNFSVMVCATRKMAFVSAVNINAEQYIEINRDTGLPGAEGESWFDDSRMDAKFYLGQDFYGEWSTYFDRGHLTRRSDASCGTREEAIRGNADTYHRPNCTPQHFLFNQSVKYWQGLERYILEYGVLKTKKQITVLTGPVLDAENFRQYDNIDVPFQFWKIVLRVDQDGNPRASAYIVNQEPLLDVKRFYVKQTDGDTVPKIDTFRHAISSLARMTGLDFSAFERFDTFRKRAGEEAAPKPIGEWQDVL